MAKRDHHGVSEQSKASIHRREDATRLFFHKRWRGAMYIGGYAVECLLKTQLMRKFGTTTLTALEQELTDRGLLPGDRTVFTHQLLPLLELTGTASRVRADPAAWQQFRNVNRWIPAWRYNADPADREEAAAFLNAVDGILQWVRNNV